MGKIYNVEITIPIITALLTILGFSVHDTIVIFDRIRENLLNPFRMEGGGNIVNKKGEAINRGRETFNDNDEWILHFQN